MIQSFPHLLAKALGGQRVVEMVAMFHYEERSYEEIARFLKCNSGTAFNAIKRANKIIKELGLWNPQWRETHRSPGERKMINESSMAGKASDRKNILDDLEAGD